MTLDEITTGEYAGLVQRLEDLPLDEACELRSLLAAKYYAYLDRAMQCKKAVREYRQIAERVRASAAVKRLKN